MQNIYGKISVLYKNRSFSENEIELVYYKVNQNVIILIETNSESFFINENAFSIYYIGLLVNLRPEQRNKVGFHKGFHLL